MVTDRKYITEFIGLDPLRFLLSVIIVIRHYYHFYGPFSDGPFKDIDTIVTEQPFYNLLSLFYHYGQYAVQMFCLISGFIFYSIYHEEIANKKISFAGFSFLRLSRLYPLHFTTLFVIAGIQLFFFQVYDTYFVYQANDLKHFLLQLFFIGTWLPSMQHSFNAPVWSVSVEIFAYLIFYMMASLAITKGKGLLVLIFVTLMFNFFGVLPTFHACLLYFFFGCLLAKATQAGIGLKSLLIRYSLISITGMILFNLFSHPAAFNVLDDNLLVTLLLIPFGSTIVLLFIVTFRKITSTHITATLKNLGNISYSLYLIHFPVQIMIFLVLRPSNYIVFNSPKILFAFLVSSILIAWIVFEYFEKPVQRYLRSRFNNTAIEIDSSKLRNAKLARSKVEPQRT